jgi:tryptophan synthase alpha chain
MDLIKKLEQSRYQRKGVHMPHVYYGDPFPSFSDKLIMTLSKSGADLIEFGIPFSDPTADGPTFIAACERALNKGVTPITCLDTIKKLRQDGLDLPIIVTSYYNLLYVAGVREFLNKIREAGGQGVIVPNLPIEEAETLLDAAKRIGIHPILQVTPTTTRARLRKICDVSSGFIYVINVEGVTGVKESLHGSTLKLIKRVRSHTDIPLLAGFGISNPIHAKAIVKAGADGVIVGSIYAKIYEKHINEPYKALAQISSLAYQIKKACNEGIAERG